MSNNSTSRRSFRDLFGQRMLCRLSGLLTLCWFTVAAQALYAQNPVISLTLKNATVREVIEAVKTQSGYSFWYRDVVKRHVHMAALVLAPAWKSVSLMHYPFRMELLK